MSKEYWQSYSDIPTGFIWLNHKAWSYPQMVVGFDADGQMLLASNKAIRWEDLACYEWRDRPFTYGRGKICKMVIDYA